MKSSHRDPKTKEKGRSVGRHRIEYLQSIIIGFIFFCIVKQIKSQQERWFQATGKAKG